MAEITLKAETGRTLGTRPSKRLRAEGKVPAVVYGLGTDPKSIAVEWRPLRAALTTDAGLNQLLNLDIEGESHLAIVKELQRHPIRQTVLHIDFILINRDEEISVEVPIVLVGEAEAVEREGGMVDHSLFTLAVNAKPADIPNEITADISELTLGDSIRVGDLKLPSGVSTDVDPEEPVAVAQITRATIEAEEIAEADAELAAEQSEEAEEAVEGEGGDEGSGDGGDDAEGGDEG